MTTEQVEHPTETTIQLKGEDRTFTSARMEELANQGNRGEAAAALGLSGSELKVVLGNLGMSDLEFSHYCRREGCPGNGTLFGKGKEGEHNLRVHVGSSHRGEGSARRKRKPRFPVAKIKKLASSHTKAEIAGELKLSLAVFERRLKNSRAGREIEFPNAGICRICPAQPLFFSEMTGQGGYRSHIASREHKEVAKTQISETVVAPGREQQSAAGPPIWEEMKPEFALFLLDRIGRLQADDKEKGRELDEVNKQIGDLETKKQRLLEEGTGRKAEISRLQGEYDSMGL